MVTVHAVHLIHSLQPGGAERVLVDLAAAAPQADLKVTVVSLMPAGNQPIAAALRRTGAEVHDLGLLSRWDVRALPRCWRLLRKLRPDILHSHLKHADLVGAVVSKMLHVPLVSTLHVIEDTERGHKALKRRVAVAARSRVAARTIAVSRAQRDWYISAFAADPARVVVLPNGIVPPAVHGPSGRAVSRAELGVPEGDCLAAVVSIMRPGKGHEDLLEALQLVPGSVGLRVVIAGDGPLRDRLTLQARAAGLTPGRVLFAGFVDDVAGLFEACDLVVHPSHSDALPTVLLQALAAGRASLATNVGGIPEILSVDVGVLVPPRQPVALAQALVSLARDVTRRERLGVAARRRFERNYSARIWAQRLARLYLDVIEENRPVR